MSNSLKFAKTLRTLSVATFGLAGVSIANSAQAAEIPMSPTLGVDSAYTIEQGSEFDYSFTYSNVDDQGATTLDYYKVLEKDFDFYEEESGNITLDQTDFGSGSEIKYYGWSEDVNDNNIFAEKTSTTNDITVKYDSGLGNYIEQNQTSAGEISGGAIANDVANLGDISADFVNNYASGTSSSGGAIYNNTGEV